MEEKNEPEANEKGKSETPVAPENSGDKYETTPVIERAREEREKLEAATAAQRIENDRAEQIMAKRALGGVTEAGQQPQVKKEETPKEYNDRIEKEISEGKHGD